MLVSTNRSTSTTGSSIKVASSKNSDRSFEITKGEAFRRSLDSRTFLMMSRVEWVRSCRQLPPSCVRPSTTTTSSNLMLTEKEESFKDWTDVLQNNNSVWDSCQNVWLGCVLLWILDKKNIIDQFHTSKKNLLYFQ